MIYWSCPRLPEDLRDSLLEGVTIDLPKFRRALCSWYAQNHRSLPWRLTRDPYRIWVSEVMLQQTQVNTVIPYYLRFVERFPTIETLARSDLQTVLKAWEGLGYYARARNLHRAAKEIVAQRAGQIPSSFADFRALPGVGDYVAAAVMSISFNRPHAAVDGNVRRVLSRIFRIDVPANDPRGQNVFREKAQEILDPSDPGTFNQAMMELGALVCTPGDPQCAECPVVSFCGAHRSGTVSAYPRRARRRSVPVQRVAVGVIHKGDRILITRRHSEGLLGGLWEFPGGKIENGESAEEACLREIKEEVGLEVELLHHLARIRHSYTHFRIVMDVFECRWISGSVRLKGPADHRWVTPEKIEEFPLPIANRRFVPLLKRVGSGSMLATDH